MKLPSHFYRSFVGTCTKSVSMVLRNQKLQQGCSLFCDYFNRSSSYSSYLLLPASLLYITTDSVPHTIIIPLLVLLFLGVLYQAQDMLLYHPGVPENSRIFVSPPPPVLPHEEVQLTTMDGINLHGFFLKQNEDTCKDVPTLVYFHGNAGNAGMLSLVPLYVQCGVNVLVIDYRGFGRSNGAPSERGLYVDGEAAVQYLHSRCDVDHKKIVLFGHSLGGAVAIHLASRSQWCQGRVAAVIAENTFTSIPDAANHIFRSIIPIMGWLPKFCHKNHYDSISKVADIHVPILFMCGEKDEVVGPQMTHRLYEAAGRNPRSVIVQIPGGTHNDTWCCSPHYHLFVGAFLEKVFESPDLDSSLPVNAVERRNLKGLWQQHMRDALVAS